MQFELAPFALPADYADGIVSLAAVKAHLGVLHDDEDDLIGACRDSAVDMVERYCGLILAPREDVTWRGESLPGYVKLGAWPVTAVASITWLDADGTAVNGDATIWRIVRRDEITLKPGQVLPSGVAAGVEIKFDAGFTDENRPAALVQAVKLFAAHLYKHREAVITGTISGEIPLGFRMLCGQYRMPVI